MCKIKNILKDIVKPVLQLLLLVVTFCVIVYIY